MNIAVILAGGKGERLGESVPKQFIKIAGKKIIEHTIDVFDSNNNIDEICVVINPEYKSYFEQIVLESDWIKVKKILFGGTERYYSSLAAIEAYKNIENCNLIFHDAVRPLITHNIINDVIKALNNGYNAIDVAISATDTIIEVNEENCISNIPIRKKLRRGQTPQAFKLEIIKKAYDIFLSNFKKEEITDDCGIVMKALPNEKIYVVEGKESNMKLTYPEDYYLLEKLFQIKSYSINNGEDLSKLKNKVIVIFGGSSGIGLSISEIAKNNQAKVYNFSRKLNGTDITNAEEVSEALIRVYKDCGRIDYVLNTAAILVKEKLMTCSDTDIENILSINLLGTINIARKAHQYLKESKGHLLLFTSSSYTRGRAFYSLYSATKAANVNFAQAISQEWESDKIKVNVVNPERTNTPMRVKNFGSEPLNTLLTPEKVAIKSLEVLLSDINGQVIDIKVKDDK